MIDGLKYITRSIWILSVVSLLTDTASEMLYPVMPIFLQTIGFSVLTIGVLEGVAEATAGLSKGYFGRLSDISGRRVPFVQAGYALSAVSKPMMALFTWPLWIFFARTIDRLGKGLRTGSRDALLSAEATSANKGKVFGFHRSMDTIGAVIGPSIALLYLYFFPSSYRTLFFLAFIPGLLAVLTTLALKDKRSSVAGGDLSKGLSSTLRYWKDSSQQYRRLVAGLVAFALFNSSDVFLLLKAREAGLGDTVIIGVYVFYNAVFAAFSFPAGIVADRIGLKQIFIAGLGLFGFVYAAMAFNTSSYGFFAIFMCYGMYAAATEGISKAWIASITDRKDTATAIGTYSGLQSVSGMFASLITGYIWLEHGGKIALLVTSVVTCFVICYFLILPKPEVMRNEEGNGNKILLT